MNAAQFAASNHFALPSTAQLFACTRMSGFLSQLWLHFEVAVPPFACDLLAFLDVWILALSL